MQKLIIRFRVLTLFTVLATVLVSCSTTKLSHPTLQATLWVQNAAEFDALNQQAYNTAQVYLQDAIDDKYWTASVEQEGQDVTALPTAIILDIDETILDNSPFQARMIERQTGFDPVEWDKWAQEGQADALVGAVTLTQKAAELGVTVFYVTNRDAITKEATRKNMAELGFPLAQNMDVILLNGERENWTSSKVERRKFIAAQYRIIMLFGDDLNDFLPAKDMTQEKRDALVAQHSDYWGKKWFILPNPIYGSWDQALTNFVRNLTNKEKEQILKNRLKTKQ